MNRHLIAVVVGAVLIVLCLVSWNQYRVDRALEELRETTLEWSDPRGTFLPAGAPQPAPANSRTLAEIGALREEVTRMTQEMEEMRLALGALQKRAMSPPGIQQVAALESFTISDAAIEAMQAYAAKGRAWGPEQVIGEPDTPGSGDIPSAWAPLKQDAGEEWLQLDYDSPVEMSEINVLETHNSGAISKVTAVLEDGREHVIWEGTMDPEQAPIERAFQVDGSLVARSVKIHMDTTRVAGWNEIDAVELIGRDQSRQWATGANASSTYAER